MNAVRQKDQSGWKCGKGRRQRDGQNGLKRDESSKQNGAAEHMRKVKVALPVTSNADDAVGLDTLNFDTRTSG